MNNWAGPRFPVRDLACILVWAQLYIMKSCALWLGPDFRSNSNPQIHLGPDSDPENPWIPGLDPDCYWEIWPGNWPGPRSPLWIALNYGLGPYSQKEIRPVYSSGPRTGPRQYMDYWLGPDFQWTTSPVNWYGPIFWYLYQTLGSQCKWNEIVIYGTYKYKFLVSIFHLSII